MRYGYRLDTVCKPYRYKETETETKTETKTQEKKEEKNLRNETEERDRQKAISRQFPWPVHTQTAVGAYSSGVQS